MDFVGIDFGTTNSVVAYLDGNEKELSEVKVLEIDSSKLVPTVIFFDKKRILIGKKALEKYKEYPNCGARIFKRSIGTKKKFLIDELTNELQEEKNMGKKYFIIDTNVFINNLEFEEKLKLNEYIIVPDIVEEKELPFREIDGNTDIQTREATRLINELLEEGKLYRMNWDKEYIPDEIGDREKNQNDRNDNKIFSVAYKLKKNDIDVILLTGDRELRNKAKAYDIDTLEPKEFLEERKDYKRKKRKILSAEDCSIIFLKELKRKIEKNLNKSVTNAVITVPANFTVIQKKIIKDVAKKAGFINIRLEDEPVAAVMVYGEESNKNEIIGVYDLGGGTFDFSIIETNFEKETIEVKVVEGDKNIGGEDFTEGLVNEIIKEKIEEKLDIDELGNLKLSKENIEKNESMMRVKGEEIKKLLSETMSETCLLEGFYISDFEKRDISFEIEREEFNNYVVDDIFDKTEDCIQKALNEANLKAEEIDKVVLAGGTACIPEIKENIKGYFKNKIIATKNLATIVAEGAVVLGKGKFNENGGIVVKEYLNSYIGVEIEGGIFYSMLNYKENLPCKREQIFEPAKDEQKNIQIKIYSKDKYSHSSKIGEEGINYIGIAEIQGIDEFLKDEIDIKITFEVDKNKELKVLAKVEDKGKKFFKEIEVSIKI